MARHRFLSNLDATFFLANPLGVVVGSLAPVAFVST